MKYTEMQRKTAIYSQEFMFWKMNLYILITFEVYLVLSTFRVSIALKYLFITLLFFFIILLSGPQAIYCSIKFPLFYTSIM